MYLAVDNCNPFRLLHFAQDYFSYLLSLLVPYKLGILFPISLKKAWVF